MPKITAINPLLQAWLLEGPLAAQVPAYIERLRRGRYATQTSSRCLNGVAHFAHWMSMCYLRAHMLHEGCIDQFLRYHLPRCDCLGGALRTPMELHAALMPVLEILRTQGVIARSPAPTGPMCCAVALEDVELEVEGVAALGIGDAAEAPRRWRAQVQAMQRLAPGLMRLQLALPAGEHIAFSAGQYINILLDDGAKRALSFANAPPDPAAPPSTAGGLIELHVRLIPRGRFTTHVFERMQVGDPVEFEGPLGRFTLHDSQRPILFVADATGFAPVKSILEGAFRRGVQRPMTLYWGVRGVAELYLQDEVQRWQREHANFRFVPVLSDSPPEEGWAGRRGLVHEAMLQDLPDLSGHEVYACGSVKMVETPVPAFLAQGLGEAFCFSDAFTPTRAAS